MAVPAPSPNLPLGLALGLKLAQGDRVGFTPGLRVPRADQLLFESRGKRYAYGEFERQSQIVRWRDAEQPAQQQQEQADEEQQQVAQV